MRAILLGLIRLYQVATAWRPSPCRYQPTCSEYAHEAIARHGLWAGGWMALFRVLRCGPGGTHGIDNVPERLEARLAWHLPWRYREAGKRRRDA